MQSTPRSWINSRAKRYLLVSFSSSCVGLFETYSCLCDQAPAFTVFDENAIDHTDKVKKNQNIWTTIPTINVKQQTFAEPAKPVFPVFEDNKNRRQALAPITQTLEDSACSFASVNTSLHQLDYVLQARDENLKHAFKIHVSAILLCNVIDIFVKLMFHHQDLSPMVIDELGLEESQKPCATFAELNRHLESALPEVYLHDIYKYLRDCEVV